MRKSSKKGVTLASLVIYIILFAGVTVFVSAMSNSMNEKLFDNRGEAINYSSLNKLQYNITDSSLNSYDVVVNGNEISYSNGDNYVYDENRNVILKNGGILCSNVNEMSVLVEGGVKIKKVTITVSFNKYLNSMTKTVISCVEEV